MQPEIVNQRVLPFILRLQRKFDSFYTSLFYAPGEVF